MKSGNRSAGFTLVEVLAAVAVIGIALGAIISGMARYADNAAHLRTKTVAMWVAHNRMTEIRVEQIWPDTGKSDGDVEMAGVEWRWYQEVSKTEDPALRRIDVRVKIQGKDGDIASLSGFTANPAP